MQKRERVDDLFTDPVAGPDALLANGMRMPPGLVVSHAYLLDDAPAGKEWFVDFFPATQNEDIVRQRARQCVQSILAASKGYLLRTTNGVLALPAHDGDRPALLLFSQQALAGTFCERSGFECTVEPISLDEVITEFLPSVVADDGWIGLDWSSELIGVEVRPDRLLEILSASAGP